MRDRVVWHSCLLVKKLSPGDSDQIKSVLNRWYNLKNMCQNNSFWNIKIEVKTKIKVQMSKDCIT